MRKIKYRAYAKEYNKIVQVDRLGLNSDGSVQEILFSYKELGEDSNEWTDLQAGQFELLEFTGQYDIESKEIYSGYIVRFTVPNPTGYESYDGEWVDTTEEEPCGEVVFKDGCYCVKYPNGELLPFNTPTSEANKAPIIKMFEVLGNVYENKELLEKEN